MSEIRHLFFGFRDITRPSERWRTLSQRMLGELVHLMEAAKAAQTLIEFPPMQKGASFNLQQLKEELDKKAASHASE